MKLSIITTFYNSEDHIYDCIKSAQQITPDYHFEHILVNDGSSDTSLEIIQNAKLKNIKIVGNQHIGRGAALNLGLANASGDYICILDSDDLINAAWIQFFLMNHEVFKPGTVFFGKVSSDFDTFKSYSSPDLISHKILNPIKLLFHNPICHSGSIFSKDSVMEINGYSKSLNSQFDWDLWLRLSFADVEFIYFNYLTAYKRIHIKQSFESSKHFTYTMRGVNLQLKAAMRYKSIYIIPVLIFSFCRVIWSLVPRKIRTLDIFHMLR